MPDWVQVAFEAGESVAEIGARADIAGDTVLRWAREFRWDRRARDLAMAGRAPEALMVGHKICPACKVEKYADDFPQRRGKPFGRCLACDAPYRSRKGARKVARKAQRLREATSSFEKRVVHYGVKEAIRVGFGIHLRRVDLALKRARRAKKQPRKVLTEQERRDYWRAQQRHRRRTQPLRMGARRAVQRAVERGELLKPDLCEGCGDPTPPEALHGHHHKGYARSHWLDVRWVCVRCHVDLEGGWGAQLHGA